MNKFVLSLAAVFVIGGLAGFGLKTQMAYADLAEISENSNAQFVAAPTNPQGGLGMAAGGSCGG